MTDCVHVTTDDGATWVRVTPNMPEWSCVNMIDPSHFDAGVAYVAADRHRLDDIKPYIFKTNDSGRNWTAITNGHPGRRLSSAPCAKIRSGAACFMPEPNSVSSFLSMTARIGNRCS